LRLIACGHSNQAIADTPIIAIGTAKRHISNIYGKLAVQSRAQALVSCTCSNPSSANLIPNAGCLLRDARFT
jgi:LuxR family maltose regulon positive regulatory protein